MKTFIGLRFQEAILKKVADQLNSGYRLALPEEESKGIDGFIGNKAVSIKPETYSSKKSLSEKINVNMIFYSKTRDGIVIKFEDL